MSSRTRRTARAVPGIRGFASESSLPGEKELNITYEPSSPNECVHCHAPLEAGHDSKLCAQCMVAYEADPFFAFPFRPLEASNFRLTPWIIGSNILVFVLMFFLGISIVAPSTEQLLRMGANFGPGTLMYGQWWRLITSCWLHGGLIHLGMNMWCLWVLGRDCEFFYTGKDFFWLYMLTGIASSLLSVAVHPMTVSIGASGAVFGLFGVLLTTVNQSSVKKWMRPEVRKAITKSTLQYTLLNLLIGAALPFVDNAGHVGGLLAGLGIGATVGRRLEAGDEARIYRRNLWLALAMILLVIYL